jgi:hypothetical protein
MERKPEQESSSPRPGRRRTPGRVWVVVLVLVAVLVVMGVRMLLPPPPPPTPPPPRPISGSTVAVTVCTQSGALATPFCPMTEERVFPAGQQPTVTCPLHQPTP